ncbi:divergent polysaccharide deacetylase family protein [Ruegeria arenilitoris]|uniref:divergent polysaccharide deacetylase family protein n=1 Tax=Ruegeria arenilitoris TaxID=1173585 RepID=UPI00147CEEF6|nr:divergent polysaccharide deacetylase family protein [Ruegeria arenilitoris]
MGGFLGGMIAGAVVVVLLGAVLSLNTPLTRKPVVTAEAPEPAPAEAPEVNTDVAETVADADLVTVPPISPDVSGEQTDTLSGLDELEAAPDAQPQINESVTQVEGVDVPETTDVTVSAEAPVVPQAPAPIQPSPSSDGEPVVAETAPEPPAVADEEETVAEVEPQPAPEVIEVLPEPQTTEVVPEPEVAEPETVEPEVAETEVTPEPQPEIAAVQPEEQPGPVAVEPQESEAEPLAENPIAVEGEEDPQLRKLPRIAAVPQIGGEETETAGPTVGTRVVPLTERDDAPTAEAEQTVVIQSGKPIDAYAAKFENPESKPLMSIILIDDEGAFGAEALKDFPYPLSFAVSPSDPEAAEKMARHREAGFEVLALADLPKAASAQDAEVSMAVWLETLPETVGILEGVDTGIQGNRKLADQVAAIAGDTGRGLITQDNGLNTVQKLAARNGVPSGVIFRDIDGARQDPKIMRRFLDQAAFRAGQQGTVVMLGRLRPDTISALLLWGLEDRGSRVAMAPISAVMMKEVQ